MRAELNIRYKVDLKTVFSPQEIKTLYLYGINIESTDGIRFSDEAFVHYIASAQKEVENWFGIKFAKQLIDESQSYYWDGYCEQFPILETKYLVREPLSLTGLLKTVEQVRYPKEWLSYAKDPDNVGGRRISIVPTGTGGIHANQDIILTGIVTQLGIQRYRNIPDYWNYQYITGFDIDKLPYDLLDITGKLASFGPLNIAGDLILGSAGIASQSLGIDGLSQSISTTSSATNAGYGARLITYQKEIEESVKRIQYAYQSINFGVL